MLGRDEVEGVKRRNAIVAILEENHPPVITQYSYFVNDYWVEPFLSLAKQVAASGYCVYEVQHEAENLDWILRLRLKGAQLGIAGKIESAVAVQALAPAVTANGQELQNCEWSHSQPVLFIEDDELQ